jgi:hypothetical protein
MRRRDQGSGIRRSIRAMSDRRTERDRPPRNRVTRLDRIAGLRSWNRLFGAALLFLSLAPSMAHAAEGVKLTYVVSPPRATREVMPNYLPKLPPESTVRVRQIATGNARHVRVDCRRHHRRGSHAGRSKHYRHSHRNKHIDAPRCRHRRIHCSRRSSWSYRAASIAVDPSVREILRHRRSAARRSPRP